VASPTGIEPVFYA